jgi:uncharacterized membrane protein
MTKQAYLEQLRKELSRLPQEEITRAIDYYEEYFDEAGEENFQAAMEDLGSPASIAPQILQDIAARRITQPAKSIKDSAKSIWLVILALFAAPIGLPLAAAFVITIAALVFSAFAIIGSLIVASFALAIGGVLAIPLSIIALIPHGLDALFPLGAGLASLGLGVIGTYFTLQWGKEGLLAIARLFKKRIIRRKDQ